MLPRVNRVTAGDEFRRAVREGRRSGTRALVVHLAASSDDLSADGRPPTVGFVVSRAVGNAVTRNRVRRRLRHLMADRLRSLPAGALVVVRALPPAADADHARLGQDLDRCLARLVS